MPEEKKDKTFSKTCLYGSKLWAATTLGRSVKWLNDRTKQLEGAGFPAPDPLTGHYIKKDVWAWVDQRRRLSDGFRVETGTTIEIGENLASF